MLILLAAVPIVLAPVFARGVSFSLSLAIPLSLPLVLSALRASIDFRRPAKLAGGLEMRFVVIAVRAEVVGVFADEDAVGAVGPERARRGAVGPGLVTPLSEERGETFLTPAAGGGETTLTRVLRPSTTFPPEEAAVLLPDLSTSESEDGGRVLDMDDAGREGRGVLKDETEATESRRPVRVTAEATDVAPAVPLTPICLLS